jgi:hypothetical protein
VLSAHSEDAPLDPIEDHPRYGPPQGRISLLAYLMSFDEDIADKEKYGRYAGNLGIAIISRCSKRSPAKA